MRTPAFTGDASIYFTPRRYRASGIPGMRAGSGGTVTPAFDPACSLACDALCASSIIHGWDAHEYCYHHCYDDCAPIFLPPTTLSR